MAKRDLVIIDDEEGGITLSPTIVTEKKTDTDPLDREPGEPVFDDLNSRFSMDRPAPRAAGADRDEVDADGNVEITDDDLDTLFPDPKTLGKKDEEPDEEEEDEEDERVDSDDEPVAEEPTLKRGWKARLAREQRLRREAEENFRDLQASVDELRAKVEGKESETEYNQKQQELGTKIAAKQAELKAAMEAGETDKVLSLQDELDDLKYERRASREKFETAKEAREKRKTTASPIVLRKVDQWKRRHQRYSTDPEFASAANVIDARLASEGLDPESDEYYKELDKRLAKLYPDEYRGQQRRETRRHPSQHQPREIDGRRQPRRAGHFEVGKNGQVRLTKFDVQTMRDFGLDPSNKDDVRAYINENR